MMDNVIWSLLMVAAGAVFFSIGLSSLVSSKVRLDMRLEQYSTPTKDPSNEPG